MQNKEENGQRNKGFKRKLDENVAKNGLEESDSNSSLTNGHSEFDNQSILLIDINEKVYDRLSISSLIRDF